MGIPKDEGRERVSMRSDDAAAVDCLIKTSGDRVARRRTEEIKECTSPDGSHRDCNDLASLWVCGERLPPLAELRTVQSACAGSWPRAEQTGPLWFK